MTSPSAISRTTISATDANQLPRTGLGLGALIGAFAILYCVSLRLSFPQHRDIFILYDHARLYYAIAAVACFTLISPLFVLARFSFGYVVGFYFYTMILGYLWINSFSQFQYNHTTAGVSAAISAVAFLLPVLLITSPIKQQYVLPKRAFERLLTLILLFSAAMAVIGATYSFKLVAIQDIYEFREQLQLPTLLRYAIGATTSVLLPYAFACFLALKQRWLACAALAISLAFYPITFSKLTLFMAAWIVTLAMLSRIFGARITTVLSLLLPLLAGVILLLAFGETAQRFFDNVNIRMITVPSSAMDIYNDYFARHELTHFCQTQIMRPFVSCSLQHPLAVEIRNNYEGLGNFNASLFATEGIASVGQLFAPISALLCGLVIAFGNRLSAGLPSRFILISSAVLPQILLNVPLTIAMLTHGMVVLFLLWYVTPRAMFEQAADRPSAPAR